MNRHTHVALHYRGDRSRAAVGQLVALDGAGRVVWSSGWDPQEPMPADEFHRRWATSHDAEVAILALRFGPTEADDYALMFHWIDLPWAAAVGAGAVILVDRVANIGSVC